MTGSFRMLLRLLSVVSHADAGPEPVVPRYGRQRRRKRDQADHACRGRHAAALVARREQA